MAQRVHEQRNEAPCEARQPQGNQQSTTLPPGVCTSPNISQAGPTPLTAATSSKAAWQVVGELARQAGPGGPHERTLLLVMGDHGMTDQGEHGGATPPELSTALFALHAGRLAELRRRCWQQGLEVSGSGVVRSEALG